MSLLSLKNIGKIYVSEGNVAVGIRGVNLSFDRGEFVAITGKSGSGKSTLLNVISGMDSYEEGELLVEGEPTSHYLQPEWESYREEYISFIFQDYNIIESFTVLENVELALLHIENKRERRARAMELIERVGLASHAHHKGSRLSGGQKQRTVIARALAKDSPILLADEPTGNLDSATSREIVALLHEISKDKLLIVVTHNFDEVAEFATRQIRIFDGAVEFDHTLRPAATPTETAERPASAKTVSQRRRDFKNGISLGGSIFRARPRLSAFLCVLLLFTTLGIFGVTALCGDAVDVFKAPYMFRHMEGRVVLTTRDGSVPSCDEIEILASHTGADDYLRYDLFLDEGERYGATLFADTKKEKKLSVNCVYGENYGRWIVGKYPEKTDEVFLLLPISYRPTFGWYRLKVDKIKLGDRTLRVTGVKYYYDNNLPAECLFTEEGFRAMTAHHYLAKNGMSGGIITDAEAISAAEAKLKSTYTQASLFFDSDKEARAAAVRLQKMGYVAVASDATYEEDGITNFVHVFLASMKLALWLLTVLFLGVFLLLCSSRTLSAFRSELAIMRSMGIPVRVIRIGIYARMLFSLIPAVLTLGALALLIFTSPYFNAFFTYLYAWQYALILLGMLLLTLWTTHTHLRRLFRTSVKKSLKGGHTA